MFYLLHCNSTMLIQTRALYRDHGQVIAVRLFRSGLIFWDHSRGIYGKLDCEFNAHAIVHAYNYNQYTCDVQNEWRDLEDFVHAHMQLVDMREGIPTATAVGFLAKWRPSFDHNVKYIGNIIADELTDIKVKLDNNVWVDAMFAASSPIWLMQDENVNGKVIAVPRRFNIIRHSF